MKAPVAELVRLATLLEERALARLAAARRNRDLLEGELTRLAAPGAEASTGPAAFSGAAALHGRWREMRRRDLLRHLAEAAAEEEAARRAARCAFGRARALGRLAGD